MRETVMTSIIAEASTVMAVGLCAGMLRLAAPLAGRCRRSGRHGGFVVEFRL